MDENLFFREVTLRLCRHLRIEEGLQSCLEYLVQHMPADALYLQRYEPSLGAMRLIANATPEKAEPLNQVVALTPEANASFAAFMEVFAAGQLPPIFVANDPENEPIAASISSCSSGVICV